MGAYPSGIYPIPQPAPRRSPDVMITWVHPAPSDVSIANFGSTLSALTFPSGPPTEIWFGDVIPSRRRWIRIPVQDGEVRGGASFIDNPYESRVLPASAVEHPRLYVWRKFYRAPTPDGFSPYKIPELVRDEFANLKLTFADFPLRIAWKAIYRHPMVCPNWWAFDVNRAIRLEGSPTPTRFSWIHDFDYPDGTGVLAVGMAEAVFDADWTHVFSIGEHPPIEPPNVRVMRYWDVSDTIEAVDDIRQAYAEFEPLLIDALSSPSPCILVHCYAGISRSASMVAQFMQTQGYLKPSSRNVIEQLRLSRPQVAPNFAFHTEFLGLPDPSRSVSTPHTVAEV